MAIREVQEQESLPFKQSYFASKEGDQGSAHRVRSYRTYKGEEREDTVHVHACRILKGDLKENRLWYVAWMTNGTVTQVSTKSQAEMDQQWKETPQKNLQH